MSKKKEIKEISLSDLLGKIDELKKVADKDATIDVVSEKLGGYVKFYVPTMEELATAVDQTTKAISKDSVYKLLTRLIATPITDEWLKAFGVITNEEVVRCLFNENELFVVFGILSEEIEDVNGIVKKN